MKKIFIYAALLIALSGCSNEYSLVDINSLNTKNYVLRIDVVGNYSAYHSNRLDVCINDYLYSSDKSMAAGAVILDSSGKPVKCNMDSYSGGVIKELSLTEEQRTRIEEMRKRKFKEGAREGVMGV